MALKENLYFCKVKRKNENILLYLNGNTLKLTKIVKNNQGYFIVFIHQLKFLILVWYLNVFISVCSSFFFFFVQVLAYVFEVLSWKFILLQLYVGWIKKKAYSPSFSQPIEQYISHSLPKTFITWNYHFLGPTRIYLFEFSNINNRVKYEMCLKLTIEVPDVILVYLLLTLNIFDMLF